VIEDCTKALILIEETLHTLKNPESLTSTDQQPSGYDLDRIKEMTCSKTKMLARRGAALKEAGEVGKALMDYQVALALDPKNPGLKTDLEMLRSIQ
jgi:Flp pilus assembly protein TadD